MTNGPGGVASFHRGLAFLFLGVAAVVQFFLAGLGAFGASSYDAHRGVGSLLTLIAIVLVILAVVGRREALSASATLLFLMTVQTMLGVTGEDVGILGGLHPVVGLLILFVAHQAARGLPLPGVGNGRTGPAVR
jgi:hypothetical protein